MRRAARNRGPLACVLGQNRIDLVRALGLAGIRTAAVTPQGDATRSSRFVRTSIDWVDHWQRSEELLERLERFGAAQDEALPLFYQSDGDLLLVSRHRERLGRFFRFVVATPKLVDVSVDKRRFSELAEDLGLPVPRSRELQPEAPPGVHIDLEFPLIIKPLTRRFDLWAPVAGFSKAILVARRQELEEIWGRFAAAGVSLLAQEYIPGPESLIESYHVYVDDRGDTAGEFTGRKIRTYPVDFGESTALETTAAGDVRELGRDTVAKLGFRGVAKIDFKRTPDGGLRVLEINPRFNLWHHLGAVAGVNLPALVYADLNGRARPPVRAQAQPGLRWSSPPEDRHAARELRLSRLRWASWTLGVEAKSGIALDDPSPFVKHTVAPALLRRVHRLRSSLLRSS